MILKLLFPGVYFVTTFLQRNTAATALRHEWFTKQLPSPTELSDMPKFHARNSNGSSAVQVDVSMSVRSERSDNSEDEML